MRRTTIGLVIALMTAATPTAVALPIGEPSIKFETSGTQDHLTLQLRAHASDPDGAVEKITICALSTDGPSCDTESFTPPASDIELCLTGDRQQHQIEHTFPGPGDHDIQVIVESASCPIVGHQDVTERSFTVSILPPPQPIPCAHPGQPTATDTGVHPDRVELGATVVQSGLAASWQGAAAIGIQAAVDRVNDTGGVCGRLLDVETVDDGGDPVRGRDAIADFIADGTFALVAMPSTAGLAESIRQGDIDAAGIPVVGTPGREPEELTSPWVWPEGTASSVAGRIPVRAGYDAGARTFAAVYDKSAPWALAFHNGVTSAVAAREGAELRSSTGIHPGLPNYSTEIQHHNAACADGCDAVIIALDPSTTLTWLAGRPRGGTLRTDLSLEHFSTRFAEYCDAVCHGFIVWTDHNPPIGHLTDPVEQYERDVRAISPTADTTSRVIQAAYTGTLLFAEAIGRVGVHLTRETLRDVLDTEPFDLGLTPLPLSWTAARTANRSMHPYSFVYSAGSFTGFRSEAGPITEP